MRNDTRADAGSHNFTAQAGKRDGTNQLSSSSQPHAALIMPSRVPVCIVNLNKRFCSAQPHPAQSTRTRAHILVAHLERAVDGEGQEALERGGGRHPRHRVQVVLAVDLIDGSVQR